jgi:hypothetical protein
MAPTLLSVMANWPSMYSMTIEAPVVSLTM